MLLVDKEDRSLKDFSRPMYSCAAICSSVTVIVKCTVASVCHSWTTDSCFNCSQTLVGPLNELFNMLLGCLSSWVRHHIN